VAQLFVSLLIALYCRNDYNMPEHPKQNPSPDDGSKKMKPSAPTTQVSPEAGTDERPNNKWFGWIHWKIVASAFIGVGAVITASLIMLQGADWIRKSIDENVTAKLNDERVLRKIAEQVRPALIFDANEAIIENMGAASYIADNGKGISTVKESDGWPRHIHIDFTKQFANPPILTSMYEVTVIIPKRGKGFSWDFDVSDVVQHGQGISTNLWLYRLELVP